MNEEAAVKRLNYKLKEAKRLYEQEGGKEWTAAHERRMAEIFCGVEILSLVTGKDYYISENGKLLEK